MVGRLIEYQQINGPKQQASHCQTGTLTTRQHGDFLVLVLTAEQERAEDIAQFGAHLWRRVVFHRFEQRNLGVERLGLVLCVVADEDVVANFHLARCWLEVVDYHLGEGRFALAVLTHKCYPLAPFHGQVHVAQYVQTTVTFAQIFHLRYHHTTAGRLWKADVHGGCVHVLHLDAVHFVEPFLHGLRQRSLRGLGHEAVDGFLHLVNHLLLVVGGGGHFFPSLCAQFHVPGVVGLVLVNLA